MHIGIRLPYDVKALEVFTSLVAGAEETKKNSKKIVVNFIAYPFGLFELQAYKSKHEFNFGKTLRNPYFFSI